MDLSVSGTTEGTEVTPGAFVQLNGPLVSATISYTRGVPRPDTLFLNEPLGTGKLRVWADADKETEIELPEQWDLSTETPPSTIYIEGIETSGSARDTVLRVQYQAGVINLEDTASVTVVRVDLKEVSLSGDYDYAVRKDDDSGDYGAPQWQDNSSPLDGDADDAGDKKYPVCYKRNTKMKTTVKMIVAPAGALDGTTKIKGDGPGNLDIPSTTASVSSGEATITDVECSNAFPNTVKWYGGGDILSIDWQLSRDDGTTWMDGASSENEAFIMLNAPACATNFRTVLYLATEGSSATTEDGCITATWANFEGPADVCAWSDTNKSYTRALSYYDGDTSVTTAAGLLSGGDGQCHAWAELFKECLRANNVANVKRTLVFPPDPYDAFGVANITFDDVNPTYPQNDPWKYKENSRTDDLNINTSGVPGQNTTTPYNKLFALHWIVHRTDDQYYYDPSYGAKFSSAAAFTDASVHAWRVLLYDPNPPEHTDYQWRKESSSPAVDVTFTDLDW